MVFVNLKFYNFIDIFLNKDLNIFMSFFTDINGSKKDLCNQPK